MKLYSLLLTCLSLIAISTLGSEIPQFLGIGNHSFYRSTKSEMVNLQTRVYKFVETTPCQKGYCILFISRHHGDNNCLSYYLKTSQGYSDFQWTVSYFNTDVRTLLPGTFAQVDHNLRPHYRMDKHSRALLKSFGIKIPKTSLHSLGRLTEQRMTTSPYAPGGGQAI